jgi:hypothetical protein
MGKFNDFIQKVGIFTVKTNETQDTGVYLR